MQQNKNILIINDMPGYGKVALAAMLPILSHMGKPSGCIIIVEFPELLVLRHK